MHEYWARSECMFISSSLFNKISWNKYQVRIFHASSIIPNTFILY